MKKVFVLTLFVLATLAWTAAQQPGGAPDRATGQSTSQNPQTMPPSQTNPQASPDQSNPQTAPAPGQAAGGQITEGCLGGSDPNYTITDKAGTTYKLNIPANTDTTKLAQHVGESVQVMGDVRDADKPGRASIDTQGIGRGTGKCPGTSPSGAQPPPK